MLLAGGTEESSRPPLNVQGCDMAMGMTAVQAWATEPGRVSKRLHYSLCKWMLRQLEHSQCQMTWHVSAQATSYI